MDNNSNHNSSSQEHLHFSINQCYPHNQPVTLVQFRQLELLKEELYQELQRNKRRISLLQKNKKIANQELQLNRQQLNAKQAKIRELEQFLKTIPEGESQIKIQKQCAFTKRQEELQIIISEKDQQIYMLSLQIKQWTNKYQLITGNQLILEEELKSKVRIISNLKESTNSQIHFYQQQLQRLQDDLKQKQVSLQKALTNSDLHFDKQKKQWAQANCNLTDRLNFLQIQMSHQKLKVKRLKQEYQKLKQENKQLSEKISQSEENAKWYRDLLEQTKRQFINAELLRQEQHQKMLKEKKYLKRNAQGLKEQIKIIKEQTTCVPSSVKSYRKSSICSVVTPFRLTPQHSEQVSLLDEGKNVGE